MPAAVLLVLCSAVGVAAAPTASASRILRDVPSLAAAQGRVADDHIEVGASPLAVSPSGEVDWTDPAGRGRSYQRLVHGLFPVRDLAVLAADGDVRASDRALGMARSWVRANPRTAPAHPMAWHDETTARRLGSVITLHEALRERDWASEDLRWLQQVASDHALILLEDSFHSAGTNHGMFQDRALLAWAFDPISLPAGETFREHAIDTATRRLASYFDDIHSRDGVHLEHSPAYHQVVMRNMQRLVNAYHAAGRDEVAAPILAAIDAAGHYATHVLQPNGLMPGVGDTSVSDARPHASVVDTDAYRFAVSRGAEGVAPTEVDAFYLDADIAVLRDAWQRDGRGTYLHITGAYHNDYHKHADDLSLWLYHDGELLTEAGMNGYEYEDPFTTYGYSAQAHNTVLVDGQGVARSDGRYDEAALTGARSDGTVSVVSGRTSRFPDAAARWKRTVRYDRSAAKVAVTDEVATARPDAERTVLWHTAPGIDVVTVGRQVLLYRKGTLTARLRVGAGSANLPVEVIEGQTQPVLGWRLGLVGRPTPTEVLRFRTREDVDMVTAIRLLRAPEPVDTSVLCPDAATVAFEDVAGTHATAISCLHGLGIAQGVDGGRRFEPAAPVRRDQVASLLARALAQAGVDLDVDGHKDAGKDAPALPVDVAEDSTHAAAIRALAEAEVIAGDREGRYHPSRPVTRAQMASLLDRAAALAGRELSGGERWFVDVGGEHADSIDRLTTAGIASGNGVDGYGPEGAVSRAQMATFLARLLTHLT